MANGGWFSIYTKYFFGEWYRTRIILYKALNSCILNEIGSIIATGKESIVLYGKGGQTEQHEIPSEVATSGCQSRVFLPGAPCVGSFACM